MNFGLAIKKYFSSSSYQNIYLYNSTYVKRIDHCALRSIDTKQYNIIHKECLLSGFVLQKDSYNFPEIDVTAKWYKSSNFMMPRVFSSVYLENEISISSYEEYQQVLKQNHYVAWTTLFPFEINHIGFSVSNIKDVYMDLKRNGFDLNGEIQISNDKDLLQFSLKSDKIDYKFSNNQIHQVYGPFIEFIERKNNREGFHTNNAAKIFESTKD
jgi:hypothetical protein